jgi:hypothetical protein
MDWMPVPFVGLKTPAFRHRVLRHRLRFTTLAVLFWMALVSACNTPFSPPTPPLSQLRKVPEYRLAYPGCSKVGSDEVEATKEPDVTVGSSSRNDWACSKPSPDQVVSYLSAALSRGGWHRTAAYYLPQEWRKGRLIYDFSVSDPKTTHILDLYPGAVALHPTAIYTTELKYDY